MKKATYHKRWTFWYTDKIANWDTCDYWEKENCESVERHVKKGDIFFSIGVEHCLNELIYAQFVGAENMVLVEPSPAFWSGIRLAWQMNGYPNPKACYVGLMGDKTVDNPPALDYDDTIVDGFPKCSWDLPETDGMHYRYLFAHSHQTRQITLDDWCDRNGIYPDAIGCDTEGAELSILRGARKTLTENNVQLWLSLHPGLIVRDFGATSDESARQSVFELMDSYGYKSEFVSKDHEEHYLFTKK